MWHQQSFTLDSLTADLSGGDSFARTPRVPRERPPRTDTDTTGTTPLPTQYISGDPATPDSNEYNVQVNFAGSWTADLQQAFIIAANAISDFILGDIPSVVTRRSTIDDIVITASLVTIDGRGGILGQAGPDVVRSGSYLPSQGTMQFDKADAGAYQSQGLFDDIVLHEMLHTIGFGTIWGDLGLVSGGSFTGTLANAAYPGTALIPVERDGGPGTAYAHWDEEIFTSELMTGYIDNDNSLSYVTIASLGDLGYTTILGATYMNVA